MLKLPIFGSTPGLCFTISEPSSSQRLEPASFKTFQERAPKSAKVCWRRKLNDELDGAEIPQNHHKIAGSKNMLNSCKAHTSWDKFKYIGL